jgi:deazaflavin-dependent oxidoreductase (nitroreductase family)
MSSPTPPPRPFTDTPQFKVMRILVGAFNPFIRRLLGSRFAGPMANSLMLLRFRGRTSGNWYTTPVGYAREANQVVVVTSPMYRWWRNVVDRAPVQLRLGSEWFEASARLLRPEDPAYRAAVALQVRERGPRMLRGFGIPVTDDGQVPASTPTEAGGHARIVLMELGGRIPRPA